MSAASSAPRQIKVWDLGVRLFHWSLVVTIALAFFSSKEEGALSTWHIPIGYVAASLIAFKLVWRGLGGRHVRPVNFVRPTMIVPHISDLFAGKFALMSGHNPLGALAVLAPLALTTATVMTGVVEVANMHEMIAYALLALVAVYAATVLLMSYLTKENLVLAVAIGRRRCDLHPDPQDAELPDRLAVPIAAIAVGASPYGAKRIDPRAFPPHASAEAGEEGENEAGQFGSDDD